MNDLPPEMIPRDLSEAKVAIAELRLQVADNDAALESLRRDFKDASEAIAKAHNEFAAFKAQLSGGWKVLVVLGGITMAISYLAYNLKNIFWIKGG